MRMQVSAQRIRQSGTRNRLPEIRKQPSEHASQVSEPTKQSTEMKTQVSKQTAQLSEPEKLLSEKSGSYISKPHGRATAAMTGSQSDAPADLLIRRRLKKS